MQILILISLCFSMFMSIEASFMDDVRSHFSNEDVTNIEKCVDTLNLFINAFNQKQKSLLVSSIACDQEKLMNSIISKNLLKWKSELFMVVGTNQYKD